MHDSTTDRRRPEYTRYGRLRGRLSHDDILGATILAALCAMLALGFLGAVGAL